MSADSYDDANVTLPNTLASAPVSQPVVDEDDFTSDAVRSRCLRIIDDYRQGRN
jgi:hypothetical protein